MILMNLLIANRNLTDINRDEPLWGVSIYYTDKRTQTKVCNTTFYAHVISDESINSYHNRTIDFCISIIGNYRFIYDAYDKEFVYLTNDIDSSQAVNVEVFPIQIVPMYSGFFNTNAGRSILTSPEDRIIPFIYFNSDYMDIPEIAFSVPRSMFKDFLYDYKNLNRAGTNLIVHLEDNFDKDFDGDTYMYDDFSFKYNHQEEYRRYCKVMDDVLLHKYIRSNYIFNDTVLDHYVWDIDYSAVLITLMTYSGKRTFVMDKKLVLDSKPDVCVTGGFRSVIPGCCKDKIIDCSIKEEDDSIRPVKFDKPPESMSEKIMVRDLQPQDLIYDERSLSFYRVLFKGDEKNPSDPSCICEVIGSVIDDYTPYSKQYIFPYCREVLRISTLPVKED